MLGNDDHEFDNAQTFPGHQSNIGQQKSQRTFDWSDLNDPPAFESTLGTCLA